MDARLAAEADPLGSGAPLPAQATRPVHGGAVTSQYEAAMPCDAQSDAVTASTAAPAASAAASEQTVSDGGGASRAGKSRPDDNGMFEKKMAKLRQELHHVEKRFVREHGRTPTPADLRRIPQYRTLYARYKNCREILKARQTQD